MSHRTLYLAIAAWVSLGVACRSRPKVGTERDRSPDAAPAVVYVERPRPQATPPVALVDEREPNDTVSEAQPFEFPKGIRGALGEPRILPGKKTPTADVDLYQWVAQVEARQVARVDLAAAVGQRLSLDVLDGEGQRIASAMSVAASVEEASWEVPDVAVEPGQTYFLRVSGRDKAQEGPAPRKAEPGYQLKVTLTGGPAPGETPEPNGDAEHAAPLVAGNEASGFFGAPRDEDWLRVTAPEGSPPGAALRLELQGVEGVAATVRVLDIGGARLAEARGGKGETVVLRNVPLVPGGALVVLRAESGATSTQRWLLRTRLEPIPESYEREPNDTAAAASQLLPAGEDDTTGGAAPAGATASFVGRGYLWPGDVDCWRVPVPGEQPQPALVTATVEPPPNTRANLRLELLGPGEQPIITVDDEGAGGGETLAPSYLPIAAAGRPGEVCLRVTARSGRDDTLAEAPYVLTASLLVEQPGAVEREPNGAAASATPLPAEGGAIRGWLAPRNDEDWYRLDPAGPGGAAPGPQNLEASLALPAGMTATVRLYDAATRKPISAAAATVRAQITGGCFLVVRASGGTSRPREPYTLNFHVAPAEPAAPH
ncbi:MAG TPA: hypothetical protein VH877_23105 [Polyangia bacterium]|jgi:hypothetical protein|nr:hypothetical protein [Polyangia bacterium]